MSMSDPPIEELGLVYVSDTEPSIRRVEKGKGFCCKLPDGSLVRDEVTRRQIASLGLPPAYRDVWICLQDNGH